MDEYISREAVFQVVHGIARGITAKDTEALKTKDMKTLYKIKGAKEILDLVDTDLCYIPTADVQPVRYGQWIWDGNKEECICSECGKGNLKYSTVFCPDCGARMDGDIE